MGLKDSEFDKLKQEAAQRMKEIHAGAVPGDAPDEAPPAKEEDPPEEKPKESLFDTFFKDKDKTIILALILLLIGEKDEKPDYSLLLALLYILI